MMHVPSASVDRLIHFVAVDETDLVTRLTGLTGFTVRRKQEGVAETGYTTPTTAEISAGNMPGVYSLALDEALTLAAGHDTEQVVLHITNTGMAPVTLTFMLVRPKITEGQTVTASGGSANAALQSCAAGAITAAGIHVDAGAKLADIFWRRTYANIRGSSFGDTVDDRSGLGALSRLVNKVAIAGSTLTTYHEDDTTAFASVAVTATTGADPITALDPS